mmetsp:Transcript_23393/g.66193  ORF Transcript_23393/g.66193 Transcript_23393/m.66193 type:complete len:258 (-) Transcript_23393:96-869(-)
MRRLPLSVSAEDQLAAHDFPWGIRRGHAKCFRQLALLLGLSCAAALTGIPAALGRRVPAAASFVQPFPAAVSSVRFWRGSTSCCLNLRRVHCRAVGATIDRPPPPSKVGDGDGDDGQGYDVEVIDNQEREAIARRWLMMATEEDKAVIEKYILPFRSTQAFTGKSRLCFAAYLNGNCECLVTSEVVPDLDDFMAFLIQRRCLRVLSILTKPRMTTQAGMLLVKAIKQMANEQSWRPDFELIKEVSSGRYYVFARALP